MLRTVRVVDTPGLLELERRAATWELNQRLPVDWLDQNLDPGGHHYLHPALEHRFSHRPDVPVHWRCELLLALRDGEGVLSLLDVMPDDFVSLPESLSAEEKTEAVLRMSNVRTVAQWQEDNP